MTEGVEIKAYPNALIHQSFEYDSLSMAAYGASSQKARVAFDPAKVVPLFVNGEEKTTASTFDVISPVDNKICWRSSSASISDVEAAVASASAAFKLWSKTKPAQRRDIILKAAQLLQEEKAQSFTYSSTETGTAEGPFESEYLLGYDACLTMAGLISAVQGTVPCPGGKDRSAMAVKEPYGVCLGIAPWNAPHILGLRACLGPIAMGNTVILKGPEASPATYWHFVDILHRAGLPPGVLNTIYARPQDAVEITTALIANPAIKKVNFTGSTIVGSSIASLCGKHLKPCLMELGGKAPSIVCADADLDNAALWCAVGAFEHVGQICMSTERIIVESSVVEEFKQKLTTQMARMFTRDQPAPVLLSASSVKKNIELLKDALSKGAKAIFGDAEAEESSKTRMRPVIMENVKEDMSIYHTESFGPTVSLYVIPSGDDFEEKALKLANDTDYGLTSAIFTEDLRKGLRLARGIETGAVHINNMTIHDGAALPHGGAKRSGFGRFNSKEGLEEWVRTKVITWKD